MPHRPLVFVSGLAVGDYLLWNWSLNNNHAVLALVSGLTLPPLLGACLWLLALTLARLLARSARLPSSTLARARRGRRRQAHAAAMAEGAATEQAHGAAASDRSRSRKLAA